MKKSFLCLIAVFLILGGLTAVAGAAVSAQVDNGGMNFGHGDMLTISNGVGNNGAQVAADFYLALILPDTTPIFFEFSGSGLAASAATYDPSTWKKLLSNVSLPSGLNTGLMPILYYVLGGAEPFGTYQTVFVVTKAGTLDVLDYTIAPFFVGSHSVSGILGSYSGMWSDQKFSSGTVNFLIADSQPGFLTIKTTLGGSVFGNSVALDPFTVSADLRSPSAIILSGGSGSFGTVTGTIGPDGSFQATVSSIPGGLIRSVDSSGTIRNGLLNLGYTINFIIYGHANGTLNATR